MAEYIPLFAPYNSIFELAVALNFSYAASENLRETIKSGFLASIRSLFERYKTSLQNYSAEFTVDKCSDYLSTEQINGLSTKFNAALEALKKRTDDLESDLNKSQELTSQQIKPIYVFTAILSLITLFLSGQEVIHERFPLEKVIILLTTSIFVYFYLYQNVRKERPSSTVLVVFVLVYLFILSMIFPIKLDSQVFNQIPDKWFVDALIITSFLPFVIAVTLLSIKVIKLETTYRFSFWKSEKNLRRIKNKIESHKDSAQYLKDELGE